MTRYERVLQLLDQSIGGPAATIGAHQAFWRGLSRDAFVAKKVFGRPLLVVGDGAGSNLVRALRGLPPFGADLPEPPVGSQFNRMPAGMPPVAEEEVAFIEQWINDGCPDRPDEAAPLQWRPTNAPVASSRTDDIWFADPQVGWAANSNGEIVHTRDGGESWARQFHDADVYFRCLGFASPLRGWTGTLTSGKTFFETRDGGALWTPVTNLPAGAPSAICGMSVVDEHVVFAAGTNFPNRPPALLKTTDGGATWTARDMKPFADLLIDVFFTSAREGWVVGGRTTEPVATRANVRPVVLRTEDGGESWVNRVAEIQDDFPLGEWGWKIQFLNASVGFVSLENFTQGAILSTADGGATWTRHGVNDPQQNANLEGVGFVDEKHGWVGGWGDASFEQLSSSETLDGGLTWRDANEIGKAINRFRFFGQPVSVGYASGETVYKYSSEPIAVSLAPVVRRGAIFESLEPAEVTGVAVVPVSVPPDAGRLTVRIWDRFGDPVRVLVDETNPAPGARELRWDGTTDDGGVAGPGHYIWRVTVDDRSESRLVHRR